MIVVFHVQPQQKNVCPKMKAAEPTGRNKEIKRETLQFFLSFPYTPCNREQKLLSFGEIPIYGYCFNNSLPWKPAFRTFWGEITLIHNNKMHGNKFSHHQTHKLHTRLLLHIGL